MQQWRSVFGETKGGEFTVFLVIVLSSLLRDRPTVSELTDDSDAVTHTSLTESPPIVTAMESSGSFRLSLPRG